MKIAFLTLGCKVNSYETEKMKTQFQEKGHQIVAFSDVADVYVVNTCTVTNIADRKSRKMLHRARKRNEKAVVVAAGCYVDSAKQKGEEDESVDLFLSNTEKEKLVSRVEQLYFERNRETGSPSQISSPQEIPPKNRMDEKSGHTRAYIKIQDGCNQYCTYCIIPYVRGQLTSRSNQDILAETEKLAQQGYQEIVITGIHLSSFGVDRQEKKTDANSFLELEGAPLLELLEQMEQIAGIERIRLGSLEPRIITQNFVERLSRIRKVCPHFHLSLQSGCDETLRRMNRHYTSEEYLQKVELLRTYFSHPAITTDIIVGFPGESREEFETTCDFAEKVSFARIHVFKYSRRHGTVADAMEGQVAETEKKIRSDRLLEIAERLERNYQQHFFHQTEKILWEEIALIDGKPYLVGYNRRYVRLALPVSEQENPEQWCNRIVEVSVAGRVNQEVLLGKVL
jgi:threonylcarbamoyladenosine tRNA methylthiotransferase MtaB